MWGWLECSGLEADKSCKDAIAGAYRATSSGGAMVMSGKSACFSTFSSVTSSTPGTATNDGNDNISSGNQQEAACNLAAALAFAALAAPAMAPAERVALAAEAVCLVV